MIVKGFIMKVLELDAETPKSRHRWSRTITYDTNWLQVGIPAQLFYTDEEGKDKVTITSYVDSVTEDYNNLTIHTQNSIYYIKKFTEK